MIAAGRLREAFREAMSELLAEPGCGTAPPPPGPAEGSGYRDTAERLGRAAVARGWAREEDLRLSATEVCAAAFGLAPEQRLAIYDAEREGGVRAGLARALRYADRAT